MARQAEAHGHKVMSWRTSDCRQRRSPILIQHRQIKQENFNEKLLLLKYVDSDGILRIRKRKEVNVNAARSLIWNK